MSAIPQQGRELLRLSGDRLMRLLGREGNKNILISVFVICALAAMLVPLPAFFMDIAVGINILLALILLMMTIFVEQPLNFSTFPSVLLVLTLFRLSLNISSTRLILSRGQEGIGAAGNLIATFGAFVGGGGSVEGINRLSSLAVGVTIFIILVIIQYLVITRGSTRVAEVAARFTLDAMPGKQMAIDADLNSGIITEQEAVARRLEIQRQAAFFGAMDGAAKFVSGDTVAGIIITGINILFGFVIGVFIHGMEFVEAARVFTILTIGDGLAAQIPALLISVGAGLLVTRNAERAEFGGEVLGQFFGQHKPIAAATVMVAGLGLSGLVGLTPFPPLPLFVVSGICFCLWLVARRSAAAATLEAREKAEAKKDEAGAKPAEADSVEKLLAIDALGVEVGYGVVPLVDKQQPGGGGLLQRVQMIRQQLAVELGIIVPPIRIRDNLELEANDYVVKIQGAPVARGSVEADRLLAIDSGAATEKLEGDATVEPAFGMPAVWIYPSGREYAERVGYTVVDAETVMATHLTEIIRSRAAELLTRDEMRKLLETLKKNSPGAVEEVVPGILSAAEVQKVLQNLLQEKVSIRNLGAILEVLGDVGRRTKDPDILTEFARNGLKRWLCNEYAAPGTRKLHVITLDPRLEEQIQQHVEHTDGGSFLTLRPAASQRLVEAISAEVQRQVQGGNNPLLLTGPQVRLHVKRMTQARLPMLAVISYNEILQDYESISVGMVKLDLNQ
ncbi:MAG: flagellar biosynthesis protein FlhA [Planctomycetota bacterium]|jgi:flagellar biosynthesis protein FlhA|nr:flagellar biosynthesis protein FlhA [Planctomycetota bacterium]MDR1520143.1 flagellar biosynthesis protein FlhA [Planctomycetota bacterium]